jgi:hypothetical protein
MEEELICVCKIQSGAKDWFLSVVKDPSNLVQQRPQQRSWSQKCLWYVHYLNGARTTKEGSATEVKGVTEIVVLRRKCELTIGCKLVLNGEQKELWWVTSVRAILLYLQRNAPTHRGQEPIKLNAVRKKSQIVAGRKQGPKYSTHPPLMKWAEEGWCPKGLLLAQDIAPAAVPLLDLVPHPWSAIPPFYWFFCPHGLHTQYVA